MSTQKRRKCGTYAAVRRWSWTILAAKSVAAGSFLDRGFDEISAMEVVGWSVGDLYCVPALGLRLTNHARSRSLITCSPQRVMYIHYTTDTNTSNLPPVRKSVQVHRKQAEKL